MTGMGAGPKSVAIIGAGLAGTALALALDQQSIPCRIYESRRPDAPELASGVVLTPNGLRVLDQLGVLERISSRCWKSEYRTVRNDHDELVRKSLITNESLYGYKNHRLWRRLLLAEMKIMLQERNVAITYGARFEGVLGESDGDVRFQVNGKEEQTALLVGADGISSSLRRYVEPDVMPEYTGVMGVIAHINRASVVWPFEDYERACTIQGKPGAVFFIPETEDGQEIMIGMQAPHPDQTRAEWDAMAADKDKMYEFYRRGYDDWQGNTAKSIIDAIGANKDTLYLWPFLKMPKLTRWYSETGNVVIVGDAAHALPPSSGQGVNQALEDIYSLTLLLKSGRKLPDALAFWQDMRQQRVDAVFDWATNKTNVQRLPEAERKKLIDEGKIKDPNSSADFDDMRWLYQTDIADQVNAWVDAGP